MPTAYEGDDGRRATSAERLQHVAGVVRLVVVVEVERLDVDVENNVTARVGVVPLRPNRYGASPSCPGASPNWARSSRGSLAAPRGPTSSRPGRRARRSDTRCRKGERWRSGSSTGTRTRP